MYSFKTKLGSVMKSHNRAAVSNPNARILTHLHGTEQLNQCLSARNFSDPQSMVVLVRIVLGFRSLPGDRCIMLLQFKTVHDSARRMHLIVRLPSQPAVVAHHLLVLDSLWRCRAHDVLSDLIVQED